MFDSLATYMSAAASHVLTVRRRHCVSILIYSHKLPLLKAEIRRVDEGRKVGTEDGNTPGANPTLALQGLCG